MKKQTLVTTLSILFTLSISAKAFAGVRVLSCGGLIPSTVPNMLAMTEVILKAKITPALDKTAARQGVQLTEVMNLWTMDQKKPSATIAKSSTAQSNTELNISISGSTGIFYRAFKLVGDQQCAAYVLYTNSVQMNDSNLFLIPALLKGVNCKAASNVKDVDLSCQNIAGRISRGGDY